MTKNDVSTGSSDSTSKKLGVSLDLIANIALNIEQLSMASMEYENAQDRGVMISSITSLATQIGWYADNANALVGGPQIKGGASNWFLPPSYYSADEDNFRSGDIETEPDELEASMTKDEAVYGLLAACRKLSVGQIEGLLAKAKNERDFLPAS